MSAGLNVTGVGLFEGRSSGGEWNSRTRSLPRAEAAALVCIVFMLMSHTAGEEPAHQAMYKAVQF